MSELKQGEHYYFTDDGLLVFTEKYLLDRGYCCGNGCRHCPYKDDDSLKEEFSNKQNKSKDGSGV